MASSPCVLGARAASAANMVQWSRGEEFVVVDADSMQHARVQVRRQPSATALKPPPITGRQHSQTHARDDTD